jgi:hypothetical protein
MRVGQDMRVGAVWAAVGLAAALALGAATVRAEGLERDSDDYNCSHGAADDPRTIQACTNLRGEPVTAAEIASWRRMGFQRASDDYRCHHGRPGSHKQVAACRRLRGE